MNPTIELNSTNGSSPNGLHKPRKYKVRLKREEYLMLDRVVSDLMTKERKRSADIAAILEQLGHKRPDGRPFDRGWVHAAMVRAQARRKKGRSQRVEQVVDRAIQMTGPRPAKPGRRPVAGKNRLPITVLDILTNPELSDSQKIRMITAYAEL